jgi:gliding motility-associated-like protein
MKILIAFFTLTLASLTSYSQIQASFTCDTAICIGDCITFNNTSTGTITDYGWSFPGGNPSVATTEDPGIICFDVPGVYTITLGVQGPAGISTFTQDILVGEYPDSLYAFGDTIIDMGGAAYVSSQGFPGGGSYNWIPNDVFDCPACPETFASPLVPTTGIIEYISPSGCAIRDTVIIGINFLDVIDVPTSFSPDDNGVNDFVFVKGPGIVSMTFRIFDRYGRLLYETTDQTEGWDGTFNGRKLPPATFLWTLEYALLGGLNDVKSGTITLIK